MPKITNRSLTLKRVCIRVWEDDYEKLQKVAKSGGDVGVNMLIREIVHSYVVQLAALERRNLDRLETQDPKSPLSLELELSDFENETETEETVE